MYVRLRTRCPGRRPPGRPRAQWVGGCPGLGALGARAAAAQALSLPLSVCRCCGAVLRGRGWLGCMRRLRRTGDLGLAAVDVAHDEDKLAESKLICDSTLLLPPTSSLAWPSTNATMPTTGGNSSFVDPVDARCCAAPRLSLARPLPLDCLREPARVGHRLASRPLCRAVCHSPAAPPSCALAAETPARPCKGRGRR